ncbi:MAG: cupin domain-containing protein [Kibdelosporangium sp.]
MESTVEFEQSVFDAEVFFRDHWRKKPLYVPGGVRDFLGRTFSAGDFEKALAGARAARHAVQDRDGDVTFIEKVSLFDPDLTERAKGFGERFGMPETWFDSVRTRAPDGIGPHFDHSDNFVLQQEGTKEWSLAAPGNIDRLEIARRMLNMPGVGSHELPPGQSVRFTLEPGDLLYIPLLWLHSGVSRGASLSLSLVCPAISLYSAVVPVLGQIARSRVLGYQPIPAFHAYMSEQERSEAAGTLRAATQNLLSRLSSDEVYAAVLAAQNDRLPGAVAR